MKKPNGAPRPCPFLLFFQKTRKKNKAFGQERKGTRLRPPFFHSRTLFLFVFQSSAPFGRLWKTGTAREWKMAAACHPETHLSLPKAKATPIIFSLAFGSGVSGPKAMASGDYLFLFYWKLTKEPSLCYDQPAASFFHFQTLTQPPASVRESLGNEIMVVAGLWSTFRELRENEIKIVNRQSPAFVLLFFRGLGFLEDTLALQKIKSQNKNKRKRCGARRLSQRLVVCVFLSATPRARD